MHQIFTSLKGLISGHVPGREPAPDYKIDPENTRVYVRFAGKLAAADIERYANALRKEPSFEPGWSEIVDLRAVEQIDIFPDQSIALADTFDPFSLSSRRAFVVANDQQRHAARMQQVLRSPSKTIGIFETLNEAEQWIRTPIHRTALASAQVLPFPSPPPTSPRSRS